METASELYERIKSDFPDVTKVSESAVRFSRAVGKAAYAVCYIDVAKQLPASKEELTSYQDSIIGRYYFEGPRSLQWSNYLYFLQPEDALSERAVIEAKHLIEADRTYARKFVLAESNLDDVLKPPSIEAPPTDSRSEAIEVWSQNLTQPGLGEAVFENISMPERVRLVEEANEAGRPPRKQEAPECTGPLKPLPFIKRFEIRTFRDYPTEKNYEFGKVNLIFGPNAVGKTSLLEAIELFYCGRNNRNPFANEQYSFRAVMADGNSETASPSRAKKLFRERNLAWYGQHEINTNTLYRSFSLYNFLDTDAAVSISDTTSNFEDNLSRLLIGPEASNVWRNIERLSDALEGRAREVRTRVEENRVERDRVVSQLERAASRPQESDAAQSRLDAMMRKLKWEYPVTRDPEEQASTLASALSEYGAFAEQAASLTWVPSPTTLQELNFYSTARSAALEQSNLIVEKWEQLESERSKLEQELKRFYEALELAREVHLLIEADLPRRSIEAGRYREDAARLAAQLAGSETLQREVFRDFLDLSLSALLHNATTERSAAEQAVRQARKRLADFTTLRDKSLNLAQQLRSIASEFLADASNPNDCPLCRASYEPGELTHRIHAGVDDDLEATAQALHQACRTAETILTSASLFQDQADFLAAFQARAGGKPEMSVESVFSLLDERRREQKNVAGALARVQSEIQELREQGLSIDRFEDAYAHLESFGITPEDQTPIAANTLVEKLSATIDTLQTRTQSLDTEVTTLRNELHSHLIAATASVDEAKTLIGRDRENVTRTEALLSKLAEYSNNFQWVGTKPLAELVIASRTVRSMADELLTARQREKREHQERSEALEHKKVLDQRLGQLEPMLQRLSTALDTLNKIKEEHSLTDLVRSALQQNRDAIEAIFARIHAPLEFVGLGDGFDTLRRLNDQEALLAQVSTGQRAAFALSIFLARNNQAHSAPPVMLIDDPIAHIDDFNALSFLDYLRTLVIDKNRQIFFATANEKVATLFERKFDFLENDFRRFNLTRG